MCDGVGGWSVEHVHGYGRMFFGEVHAFVCYVVQSHIVHGCLDLGRYIFRFSLTLPLQRGTPKSDRQPVLPPRGTVFKVGILPVASALFVDVRSSKHPFTSVGLE